MAVTGFWDNQDQAREVIAEANRLKGWVDPWKRLEEESSELVELGALLEAEPDDDLEAEWLAEVEEVERGSVALEVRTMLQGSDDHRGALLTVHPGAGGLESQDWAEMLTRMYTRWAERRGYSVNELLQMMLAIDGYNDATIVHNTSKPTAISKRTIDFSRARERLGFRPKTSMREGLTRVIQWYREHRLPPATPAGGRASGSGAGVT